METRNTIKEYIFKLIAEELDMPITELNEEMSLVDDLGLESLEIVNIVADVEEKYQIRIEDDDIKKLQVVKDVIDILSDRLK